MKKFAGIILVLILTITGCRATNQQDKSNTISSEKVMQSIDKGKPVLISNSIITGDIDFSKVQIKHVFSSTHSIAQINVPITFLNCVFMGKINTTGAKNNITTTSHFNDNITFEACDFRAEVNFDNSLINGMVNFTGAIFRERASFNNMHILGRHSYFTSCTAEKQFSMQESLIAGNADFFKAVMNDKLSFQSTEFAGDLRMNDIKCNGKTDLSLTIIRGNLLANYAQFNDEFRMSNARIEGRTDMVTSKLTKAWINNSRFGGRFNLSNSEIMNNLELFGSIFAIKPEMEGIKGAVTGL